MVIVSLLYTILAFKGFIRMLYFPVLGKPVVLKYSLSQILQGLQEGIPFIKHNVFGLGKSSVSTWLFLLEKTGGIKSTP